MVGNGSTRACESSGSSHTSSFTALDSEHDSCFDNWEIYLASIPLRYQILAPDAALKMISEVFVASN